MPDYIYLLENRLSADQQHALNQLREVAREAGVILFLTGDAVRDLTSGHAVRDLEVAVHGNALKLKKPIERVGGKVWGEHEPSRTLYLCFPGTVRVDLVSTHRIEYPKPGKAVFHAASIQDDLRRRDFTVNAMAISLNEGSFGLLMDPLNGVADIEARTLRLVSNYGFLEEPSLLIRATRYKARLGWELDPRTQVRYDNALEEGVIASLSDHARSFELEQIGHEDEGLKVLRALETEGWMKVLFPAWTSAKADEAKLTALHDLAVELLMQGVHPDMSAAQMQLLTSKLQGKDLTALKKELLRPGFVEEWNSLDQMAAAFQKVLLAKENQLPSAAYKLFTSYDPEAVLWLGFTSNSAAVKDRFNQFLKVWPEAKQRIPIALMLEMRITPELANYNEILHQIFLQLIDGKLTTPEEQKAFLEPYSPPAPPPQITIRRSRAKRNAEKVKERSFEDEDEAEDALGESDDLDDLGADDDELALPLPKSALDEEASSDEDEVDEDELEEAPAPSKTKKTVPVKAAKVAKTSAPAPVPAPAKPVKEVAAKPVVQAPKQEKKEPVAKVKPVAKPAPKAPVVKAKPAALAKKPVPAKTVKTTPKPAAKKPAAKVAKVAAKPAKTAKAVKPAKHAPAKKKPAAKPVKASRTAKPVAKKPAGKTVKRK
ncbi:MAG: CCA tRNA nucleotidyltransferase [Terracidiphilus sp.]|nr:CCA tRNA nucleotidyltransferase [Terracidiphilus sp.]